MYSAYKDVKLDDWYCFALLPYRRDNVMLRVFNKHLKNNCEVHRVSLVTTKGLYFMHWESRNC